MMRTPSVVWMPLKPAMLTLYDENPFCGIPHDGVPHDAPLRDGAPHDAPR